MRVTVEKEWDHISQRRYRCIHETTLRFVRFLLDFISWKCYDGLNHSKGGTLHVS